MTVKEKHPNAFAKKVEPEGGPSSIKPGSWAIVDGETELAVGATEEMAWANAAADMAKLENLPPPANPDHPNSGKIE